MEDRSTRQEPHATHGTRRQLLSQGVALFSAAAISGALPLEYANAAQASKPSASKSLYDRLGGIFAIAAVVNYFSDEIVKDPIAGARSVLMAFAAHKNEVTEGWRQAHGGRQ